MDGMDDRRHGRQARREEAKEGEAKRVDGADGVTIQRCILVHRAKMGQAAGAHEV